MASLFDRVLGWLAPALVRDLRAQAAPQPSGAPWVYSFASPHGVIARISVPQLRRVLEVHEQGDFSVSGLLADHLGRSAVLSGALEQRLGGVQGLPFELEAADASTNAQGLRDRVEERWPIVFPRGTQRAMLRDRVLLGFSVARLTGAYHPALDEVVPAVERWHPSNVQLRLHEGQWYARTADGWILLVDAQGRVAEGWIVSFAGDRATSHLEGALRCLGEPFLGEQLAERDARRLSERMGQGFLKAKVPAGQSETEEAKGFTEGLQNVGAAGVLVCPQYPDPAAGVEDGQPSYDVEVIFPPGEGLTGLLELDDHEAHKLRVRILGQDTTSKDSTGGGYARAAVGNDVRQDLLEGDARALEEIAGQVFDGWALLERRARRQFPEPEWCTEPPSDEMAEAQTRAMEASTLTSFASALPLLRAQAAEAGLTLDEVQLWARFGVPVETTETEPDA